MKDQEVYNYQGTWCVSIDGQLKPLPAEVTSREEAVEAAREAVNAQTEKGATS